MKIFITWVKGKKTIILNALMFILMVLDSVIGYGWVAANSEISITIATVANAIVRFFTDSPIFDNGVKKK